MHHVLNMGDVFNKVTRPACLLVLAHDLPRDGLVEVADISSFSKTDKPVEISNDKLITKVPQSKFVNVPGHLFITSNVEHYAIWSRVKSVQHATLDRFVDKDGIQRGVSPDLKEAFLADHETAKKWGLEKSNLRQVLTGGKQVKRYFIEHPDLLLIYTRRNDNFQKLPNICRFIDQFKEKITCKEVKEHKHQLYAPGLYTGYGAKTLPGVREASEAGRMDEAGAQAKMVAKALKNFAVQVEEADKLLRSMD